MGAPSVPFLMLADGYKITSGSNGFRAQASFLVGWGDAFTMHDEIMGYATAATVGPLTFNSAWQFPGAPNARLACSSCEITPFALDGGARSISVAKGMAPGEFWSHARLDCTFETPTAPQSAADDPGNLNQLDSNEPIYGCEQSVRIGTKSETIPKENLRFDGTTTAPPEDISVLRSETNITLTWEFVPFVAWKKLRPYVGKVNTTPIFDVARGELLMQGIQFEPAQGPQGKLGVSVTMEFLVNDLGDWNKAARNSSGVLAAVETTDNNPIYAYTEFRQMFLS
jgi:hypothetical protein